MIAVSQVQKHFQKRNIYKRSKRYFDVEKIQSAEYEEEVKRRKPSSVETLDTRVDSSFANGQKPFHEKIRRQIEIAKSYNKESRLRANQSQMIHEGKFNKMKVLKMEKMLSRNELYSPKSSYLHENQFNNFYLSSPQNKNLTFEKILPRQSQKIPPQTYLDSSLNSDEIGKIQQKFKYDETINKCLFDYDKKSFNEKGQKNIDQQVIIPLKKLQRSQKLTRKNLTPNLYPFYLSVSRQVPSQMDSRFKTPLQDSYLGKKEEEEKIEFEVRRRKEEMVIKRTVELLQRRRVEDKRSEMCDMKYFRRNWLDVDVKKGSKQG